MVQRSTGGEQLQAFEGLVHSTARMFAGQVRREEEDLAQELRVRVWAAIESYNTARAKESLQRYGAQGSLERYVFMAITNKIKDFKRDAARRAAHGVTIMHIEDLRLPGAAERPSQERFDGLFHHLDRDEVYARIDEGLFVLPSTVTRPEAEAAVLFMAGFTRAEVAMRLGISRTEVDAMTASLREKFSEWRPGLQTDASRTVGLVPALAA